jgi:hypothetical protein
MQEPVYLQKRQRLGKVHRDRRAKNTMLGRTEVSTSKWNSMEYLGDSYKADRYQEQNAATFRQENVPQPKHNLV